MWYGLMVWILKRVANPNEELVKHYYMVISSNFGVLCSYGGDSGARWTCLVHEWYHMYNELVVKYIAYMFAYDIDCS